MDIKVAIDGFGALAQQTRLDAFRLLVRSGIDGMAAGEIAQALNVPQNTLSSHLTIMVNAGLLVSRREGRSIIYCVDLEGTQALLTFLLEDCCQGHPQACISLLEAILPRCRRSIDSPSARP
ncbi:metalloregulator ArsR/SmtB family transcription factor [Gammaproteobacteria bacterium]|nr:metalloregulator ArsR/SmtB family transcription factor [Gammaproteobacteria bacterium]